jgi:hypothetical protein
LSECSIIEALVGVGSAGVPSRGLTGSGMTFVLAGEDALADFFSTTAGFFFFVSLFVSADLVAGDDVEAAFFFAG